MYKDAYIIATYLGNGLTFKKGQAYLLKIEVRPNGIYPIYVIYDYAQYYKEKGYDSIIEFLKDWSEIMTNVDKKKIKEYNEVCYVDDGEDDLPFADTKYTNNSTSVRESSQLVTRIPKKPSITAGQWFCPTCKTINEVTDCVCKHCGRLKMI